MTPSLFSLFKRGRYFRAIRSTSFGEGEEFQRERKEIERFLVAAIGFACVHDPCGIGRHLLACVHPELAEAKISHVQLEKKDLDLILELMTDSGPRVVIIEAKAGAPLSAHQNYASNDFWKLECRPAGYGTAIQELFGHFFGVHYVVLGHTKELGDPCKNPQGWSFKQVSWADIARDFPRSALAQDLQNLFVQLNIPAFMFEKTAMTAIADNLGEAVKAFEVLEHVCERFKFVAKYRRPAISRTEDGWYLGMDLNRVKDTNDRQQNLNRLAQHSGKIASPIAWFGYEGGERASSAVWLYCDSAEHSAAIRCLVTETKAASSLEPSREGEIDVIFQKNDPALGDREWFEMIFLSLGLKLES